MKFYAVLYHWDGLDTEEPMTEWFTTKTEAIARAKEINIDPEDVIRNVTAYKAEVPTTKKALLKWLNWCGGVCFVPGNHRVWEQPSDGKWGSE
tara:strand:+ start:192 stop:470 length:279 start_codon:yes stop_codon:yes gene_type:complete